MLRDEVDGHGVLGAPGDYHVRVLLGGQAELLEGRLHQARVLRTGGQCPLFACIVCMISRIVIAGTVAGMILNFCSGQGQA